MVVNTNWNTNVNENCERNEIYKYKKKEDFKMCIDATTNNNDLLHCFDDLNEDLETSANRWISILNSNIKKTFKRIWINHTKTSK